MQVTRWGNSLAIRLPAAVVDALALKEGDDIEVRIADDRTFDVARDQSRIKAIEAIRRLRRPLPPGWSFDRDDANGRDCVGVFLDTNILIYAFGEDPRAAVAERLLADGGEISVQVLNEFVRVARRKLGFDWDQLDEAMIAIRTLARRIHDVDIGLHEAALTLARRHAFSIYDALIVAAALRGRCEILYSEDMHDGLVVANSLRIVNPFVER